MINYATGLNTEKADYAKLSITTKSKQTIFKSMPLIPLDKVMSDDVHLSHGSTATGTRCNYIIVMAREDTITKRRPSVALLVDRCPWIECFVCYVH